MELRIDHAQALLYVAADVIRCALTGKPHQLAGFFDQSLYEPAGVLASSVFLIYGGPLLSKKTSQAQRPTC